MKVRSAVVVAWMLVTAAAGCGGGDSANTEAFIGVWKFDEEKVNGDCSGMPIAEQDLAGKTLTLTKGDGAKLMAALLEKCMLTLTVSGNTATADEKQVCTIPFGQFMPTVSVTLWTMTTDDGKTMTTQQKGTAAAGACTISGSGKLTKQPD